MRVYYFFLNPIYPFFRKSITSFILLITFFLGLIFPPTATASVLTIDPNHIATAVKKIEEQIQSNLQNGQIPGCAIAVVFRNQVIFIKGYGVRSTGGHEKTDIDTLFQLGSVSKPIAATLASILEDHGLLHMEEPVNEYLPSFALNNRQLPNALKIKHLLSHTSGVPRNGFNNLIESFTPPAELRNALQRIRVPCLVGQRYDYHNAMFGLIGNVIQAATLQSFSDALKTNLLLPLHMTNTSSTYEALMRHTNRASPHIKTRGRICPCEPYSRGYYAVAPAGGINSSARDMANFLKAQMGGFPQVVSAKALARVQAPLILTDNLLNSAPCASTRNKNPSYGLGWRVLEYANHKLVYHGGWVRGFTNFLAFLPDQKLGIVVLHNSEAKFSTRLAMNFFETALGLPPANKISALFERHKEKHRKQMSRARASVKRHKQKHQKQMRPSKNISKKAANIKGKTNPLKTKGTKAKRKRI
jgi:beta-lactamase class C